MTPLIPYADFPELVILRAGSLGNAAPLSLKPFGLLVSAGVYLGAWATTRYARRRGVSTTVMASFIYWVVGLGFVGGHMLDVVFYSPERLFSDPLSLFRLWDGLSSFGGFIGGAVGALVWRLKQRVPILPYADLVASGLPLGWFFGRAGCASVHDHPGFASDAWYAVAFPSGGRLDLGFIEMMLTLPLALVFLLLQRRAFPWGFFLAVMCCVYAPVRFGLDFLRIHEDVPALDLYADRRLAGLTPAQWACVALLAFGVVLLRRVLASASSEAAFRAPERPAAFAAKGDGAPPEKLEADR